VNSSHEILSSNDTAHVENKSNIVLPSNADFDILHGPVPSSEAFHGTFAVSDLTGVQGNVTGSKPTTIKFQLGNSLLNYNQKVHDHNADIKDTNEPNTPLLYSVDNGSQQNQPLVTPDRDEVTMGLKATLSDFVLSAPKPTKRSKRREDSVDEDSCTRAERLKAKKNLDGPGTSKSKSFLSFSDSRIVSNITTLGISIGDDVLESIGNLKALEQNRLVETSTKETKLQNKLNSDEEDISKTESDMEFDQNAIKHLVGDIAEEVLGVDGSPRCEFKPAAKNKKSGSTKKKKRKNKNSGRHYKCSQ
jgi:hypothetical protein